MNRKLEKYIDKLIDKQVYPEDISDDNISLFVEFIRGIYEGDRSVAVFTFPFLEKIDEFITSPENIDMIEDMFDTIRRKEGKCDIISSGNFGLYLYDLIGEGYIDFDGNVVIVSGNIRKVQEDALNSIEILKQRYDDIEDKDFVFLDDSYFSGGTRDKINEFLEKFGSKITRTFVFYTHNPEDPRKVYSTYCYSQNHDEEVIPIHKYSEYVKNIDLREYEDEIWDRIHNGEFKKLREFLHYIKGLGKENKPGRDFIIKYENFFK